jgi:sulfonate transport system substrate-binding protein
VRAHSVAEHDDPAGSVAKENTGAVKLDDKAAAVLAETYRTSEPLAAIDESFRTRFGHVADFFAQQGVIQGHLDPATFTVDAGTLAGS